MTIVYNIQSKAHIKIEQRVQNVYENKEKQINYQTYTTNKP